MEHLTRAQARKLIFNTIDPLLKKEGFTYKKGNNVWRITDVKTDVIEVHFLRLEQRGSSIFDLPESTFSILYGCYYPFIPNENGVQFLHRIDRLLTPREVDCHVRFQATRTIKQNLAGKSLLFSKWQLLLLPYKKPKLDVKAWHLDEPKERQVSVLNDVLNQMDTEVIPTLNNLMDISNWIQLLERNKGATLGLGRDYLLGFTYKYLGNNDKARSFLTRARDEIEAITTKIKLSTHPSVAKEYPHILDEPKQLQILTSALADLEK